MRLSFFPNMKLTIEPIPESTWGKSLANLLPRPIWDDLRHEVYSTFNYSCAICGATNKELHCHEVWAYDDKLHIQRLVGFQCLCVDCHAIKHWGRTVAVAHSNGDQETIPRLTEHFCKVNNCTQSAFSLYKVEIGNVAQARNRHKYKVDFGKFTPANVEAIWKRNKGRK